MKDRLCQYGNCEIETTTVTVSIAGKPGERPAFCGRTHAALYLLATEGHRQLAKDIEIKLSGKSSSVQCPHCKWGFDPSVIDAHIREKHS